MSSESAPKALPFGTTVDYFDTPPFKARRHIIPVPPIPPPGRHNFLDEARLFARVIRAALREKVLLLYSSRGYFKPELLAAAFIALWPRWLRPILVFYGDMYEPTLGSRRYSVERLIIQLANHAIQSYVVYSEADRAAFSKVWGIDSKKVHCCPAFAHYANEIATNELIETKDYVFAGGESFRNFTPLLEAAARLPEYKFLIASSLLKDRTDLPSNVSVITPRFEEYMTIVRTARVVVVPLLQDLHRSAGAATYLNAMWVKKPVIVTESLGVREYVTDGKTGRVVDGSPESYIEALRWMLDPANSDAVATMCEEAHEAIADHFTVEHHITRLLDLIDETIAEAHHTRSGKTIQETELAVGKSVAATSTRNDVQ